MNYEAIMDKDAETGKFWVWFGAFTGIKDGWGEEFSTRLCQKRRTALDRAKEVSHTLGMDIDWGKMEDRTVECAAEAVVTV